MPLFATASSEGREVLDTVIEEYHPHLREHGVTVGLLAAWPRAGGDDAPLKLHGYPCLAVVKVTPYRQRVQGIQDAVITLDGPAWERATEAERIALLDHELTHLELIRDDDGAVKTDDALRPRLKCRLHDWNLGGFEVIARRHGDAAPEVVAWKEAHTAYSQAVFAWADDNAPADPLPSTVTIEAKHFPAIAEAGRKLRGQA